MRKSSKRANKHYTNYLLEKQNNKCAICEIVFVTDKDFVRDHNHKTGHIRGLLCRACNISLGNFENGRAKISRVLLYSENLYKYLVKD